MAAVFASRSRWATTRLIAADAIRAASSPAASTARKSTTPAKTAGRAALEVSQDMRSFHHCMRAGYPGRAPARPRRDGVPG